jgi:hypothetical protein
MYKALARVIIRNSEPPTSFLNLLWLNKIFDALLISVRCAFQTCNKEFLRSRLFTLHHLPLIAIKLAVATDQNLRPDTGTGFQ